MKRNMGTADRVGRVVVAIVLGTLVLSGKVGGTLAVVLGVVTVVFLATSAVGICPLYTLVGTCTCKCDKGECPPKGQG